MPAKAGLQALPQFESMSYLWAMTANNCPSAKTSLPLPPDSEARPNGSRSGAKGKPAPEFGGPQGPEPTRYGDWERNGRCSDF
ncbi:MAG: DUF1674 domain-containing protein [Alphaproteobacteria bacterium]|nr:DUF1674 domain-containing protein [Alphaproteobacteria bacterium]